MFVGSLKLTPLAFRWQARKEGDRNMRAGLIPSRALQERRIIHERTQKGKPEGSDEGKWHFFWGVVSYQLARSIVLCVFGVMLGT